MVPLYTATLRHIRKGCIHCGHLLDGLKCHITPLPPGRFIGGTQFQLNQRKTTQIEPNLRKVTQTKKKYMI